MDRVVGEVEELGYETFWVGDHIAFPRRVDSPYPYNPQRRSPFDPDLPLLEAITLLSYVAGRTSRIRLGIGVLVLPIRQPLLTSKMLSTLATLARGRLILGVGVGWMREEFDAFGASFESRGAAADEWLDVFFRLSESTGPTAFQGQYYRVPDVGFEPRGAIPIVVGGNGLRGMRRAAARADGWHPIRLAPAQLGRRISELEGLLEAAGRERAGFSVYYRGVVDQSRPLDSLIEYASQGVSEFIVEIPDANTDERIAHFRAVARVWKGAQGQMM